MSTVPTATPSSSTLNSNFAKFTELEGDVLAEFEADKKKIDEHVSTLHGEWHRKASRIIKIHDLFLRGISALEKIGNPKSAIESLTRAKELLNEAKTYKKEEKNEVQALFQRVLHLLLGKLYEIEAKNGNSQDKSTLLMAVSYLNEARRNGCPIQESTLRDLKEAIRVLEAQEQIELSIDPNARKYIPWEGGAIALGRGISQDNKPRDLILRNVKCHASREVGKQISEEQLIHIYDKDSVKKYRNISGGATANIHGVGIDVLGNSIKEDSLEMEHVYVMLSAYREMDSSILLEAVIEESDVAFIREHREEFMNKYGEHCVAGYRIGCIFRGIIEMKATNADQAKKLHLAVSGEVQSLVKVEAAVQTFKSKEKCNIAMRMYTEEVGSEGGGATCSSVQEIENRKAAFFEKAQKEKEKMDYSTAICLPWDEVVSILRPPLALAPSQAPSPKIEEHQNDSVQRPDQDRAVSFENAPYPKQRRQSRFRFFWSKGDTHTASIPSVSIVSDA